MICGNHKNIILPNTGIQIALPRLQFIIKSKEEGELHTVIPDYQIKLKIDYMIEQKDKDLEFTFGLINKSTQQWLQQL